MTPNRGRGRGNVKHPANEEDQLHKQSLSCTSQGDTAYESGTISNSADDPPHTKALKLILFMNRILEMELNKGSSNGQVASYKKPLPNDAISVDSTTVCNRGEWEWNPQSKSAEYFRMISQFKSGHAVAQDLSSSGKGSAST